MTPRQSLREATAAAHLRVDRLFGAFDLGEADGYRRFLAAQAAAFLPVEEALDSAGVGRIVGDWPERRRSALLRQDLRSLDVPDPEPVTPPPLPDDAALLGALYVLEGSRLGGAMLGRGLAPDAPSAFLGGQVPGKWRKLVAILDRCLYETTARDSAIAAARATFRCFEAAGRRFVESRPK